MSPAQRPRPDDEAPDLDPPDAGASFSGAVTGRRGRPPLLLLVFGVAVASLVAVGLGGRGPTAGASPSPIVAAASPSGAVAPSPAFVPDASAAASPDHAPILTSAPGAIQLAVRRHPESIFISGDVFVERVSWVFVSIQDAGRRIAGWTSVSVPGGAGPANGDGPTFRFAVEVALPEESRDGPLLVQVNAYSSSGQITASTTLEVAP